jgi:hypothetical protein
MNHFIALAAHVEGDSTPAAEELMGRLRFALISAKCAEFECFSPRLRCGGGCG